MNSVEKIKEEITIKEFDKISVIGEGSYSKVILAKHKGTGTLCALKTIQRSLLQKENKEHQLKSEHEILASINHHSIVKLLYYFTGKETVYFGLEYAPNGELSTLLKVANVLPFNLAQYYMAELVITLEYLHSHNIAHRDLKPENILLDKDYRLKITDFGTARFMNQESGARMVMKDTKVTFVGTPEYVSPEVLLDTESGTPSDIWALGCILFKFFVGESPFSSASKYMLFDAIIKKNIMFPADVPKTVVNFCKKLLVKEPSERLGTGPEGSPLGFDTLKKDEFFEGIDFEKLQDQKPPIDNTLIRKLKEKKKNEIVYDINSSDEESDTEGSSIKKQTSSSLPKKEEKKKDNYKVIKEGIVKKKCGWLFYYDRKLILTNRPRLYYTLKSGEYRGNILLTKKVRAEKSEDTRFLVITPKRKYKFVAKNKEEKEAWIKTINSAIHDYCY